MASCCISGGCKAYFLRSALLTPLHMPKKVCGAAFRNQGCQMPGEESFEVLPNA